jgi:hypothetical protein
MPPRKLIVTNAEIVASSSDDSGLTHSTAIPTWRSTSTVQQPPPSSLRQKLVAARGPVGLGLSTSVPPSADYLRRHSVIAEDPAEDSESSYEDDPESEGERIRLPSSLGRRSGDIVSVPPSNASTSEGHTSSEQRRFKTLSALVDVLDFPQPSNGYSHEDSYESEYAGQPGLAISPSMEIESQRMNDALSGPTLFHSDNMRTFGAGRESVVVDDPPLRVPSPTDNCTPTPRLMRACSDETHSRPRSPTQPDHCIQSSARMLTTRLHHAETVPREPLQSPSRGISRPPPRSRKRDDQERFASEAYDLRNNLRQAEAQSRAAFGIPPSPPTGEMAPAESTSSIGADTRWRDEAGELSVGAEEIFERFGSPGAPRGRSWVEVDTHAPSPAISVHSTASRNSLPSSTEVHTTTREWPPQPRSCAPDRTLTEATEDARQEAFRDLCASEEAFVGRLCATVALFVRPLRIKDTKLWIEGVPTGVARLFDWLEDIVHLHTQLVAALRRALDVQFPVALRVAEVVRAFVPRLEVYQPYVVRVEEVVRDVRDMARDHGGDFGEFVRIQERNERCRGWTLDKLLSEPINRLIEYPSCFRVRTFARCTLYHR